MNFQCVQRRNSCKSPARPGPTAVTSFETLLRCCANSFGGGAALADRRPVAAAELVPPPVLRLFNGLSCFQGRGLNTMLPVSTLPGRWTRSGFMLLIVIYAYVRACVHVYIYGFCYPVFSESPLLSLSRSLTHSSTPFTTPPPFSHSSQSVSLSHAHPHTPKRTHALFLLRGSVQGSRAAVLRLAPYIRFPPPKQYGQTTLSRTLDLFLVISLNPLNFA